MFLAMLARIAALFVEDIRIKLRFAGDVRIELRFARSPRVNALFVEKLALRVRRSCWTAIRPDWRLFMILVLS